jgi:hypothetical protein
MRRDEPNRHGRAADALVASYLRELLEDEPNEPVDTRGREPEVPGALLAAPVDGPSADATA